MQINKNAEKLIRQLNNQGYEAFIVGGCVRDYLLGLTPHDTDICTNALPEQTKKCFEAYHTFDTGIKHGTISVVCGDEVYEITTYRIDGDYSDNRHPDSVSFTRNINEDLQRRDFTVNTVLSIHTAVKMTLKIKLSVVSEIPIHALMRMLCESCGHYALPLFTDFQLKTTHQSLYLKMQTC